MISGFHLFAGVADPWIGTVRVDWEGCAELAILAARPGCVAIRATGRARARRRVAAKGDPFNLVCVGTVAEARNLSW